VAEGFRNTFLHLITHTYDALNANTFIYVHSSAGKSVQTLTKCLAYILVRLGCLLNWNQTQNSFTAILKTYFVILYHITSINFIDNITGYKEKTSNGLFFVQIL
jgi:hypothetical protein